MWGRKGRGYSEVWELWAFRLQKKNQIHHCKHQKIEKKVIGFVLFSWATSSNQRAGFLSLRVFRCLWAVEGWIMWEMTEKQRKEEEKWGIFSVFSECQETLCRSSCQSLNSIPWSLHFASLPRLTSRSEASLRPGQGISVGIKVSGLPPIQWYFKIWSFLQST